MLIHPNFDPTIISIGPISIRWYGLMYLLGFLAAWRLGRGRAARPDSGWTVAQFDDLLTYCILGLILGARIGWQLFYDFSSFVRDPLTIVRIWQGGMSFHGGFLGLVATAILFGRKHGKTFLDVADFLSPLAPPGLFFGRIGNFINAELWGRPTEVPWGMVFPLAGDFPRHPSQLYQAFFEGLVLFLLVYGWSAKPRPKGSTVGLFLLGYGVFRFGMEFFREPDAQLGFVALDFLSMGQILSAPMILAGLWLFLRKSPSPLKKRT